MFSAQNYTHKLLNLIFNHYILSAFLLTALVSLVQCGMFYLQYGELFYVSTDSYTRALRILDWLNDFQWREKMFPYFNPPSGFVLHFTRICDVIWLILAAPFMPFMPLKEAIFYGGMFFSPLFMTLTVITVLWGIKPYLPPLKNQNICFLLFTLIVIFILIKLTGAFDFSRPDHHALMDWIMAIGIAVILRNHLCVNMQHLFWCGLLCGVGMWASSALEGLFIVAIMLSVLAVNRIFYQHDGRELLYFSLGLFLSTTIAWLLNPPYQGHAMLDINRLSVIHSTLTALIFLSFLVLKYLKTNRKSVLIAAFGFAAIVSGFFMLLIFGCENILVPIYNQTVFEVFILRVDEMQHQPLLGYEIPAFIIGFGSMLWLLFLSKLRQSYIINLLLFFIPIFVMALLCRRFFTYYLVIFVIVYGLTLFILLYKAQQNDAYKWKSLLYIVALIFYLGSFSYKPIRHTIPQIYNTVLTDLFRAPELVYYLDIDAVGAPYHTNIEGISDNHTMWFTTDENELKTLLKKHNVQTIYLPKIASSAYYVEPSKNTDKLYGKVICNQKLYPWLIKQAENLYYIDYTNF